MLLKRPALEAIARGEVTLVFRRWLKPTVKSGGTLRTAVGLLAIDAVEIVDASEISDDEAARAGHGSADALRQDLAGRGEGAVYRIAVRSGGADPRVALREDAALSDEDRRSLTARLARLDGQTPWTGRVLELIAGHPGRRAGDLAPMAGLSLADFKQNVRKLKALGLTESLEVGYRLSPRGAAFRAG